MENRKIIAERIARNNPQWIEQVNESTFDSTAGGSDGTKFNAESIGNMNDAVSARVGTDSTVNSDTTIDVRANDKLETLMVSGTAAVGGGAGVGVGLTVGVLNSNVYAEVDEGATLTAGGDITVKASTGADRAQQGFTETNANNPLKVSDINSNIAKAEGDKNVSFNQSAFDKFGSATRDFSNLSIPSNYNYY